MYNRVYVASAYNSTISVLRDSMSGVEETMNDERGTKNVGPTVLSGSSVQSLGSKVIFDAMGRRVANPRSGIFFVQERSAVSGKPSAVSVRKVVIQR